MTGTIADLIKIAKNEVGYHEGRTGMTWNNRQKYSDQVPGLSWSDGQPWCATFVSWCAMKAGLAELFPRTASTDAGAKWFKERHQWSVYPAVGAQVFFGVNGDMNHTGIVYGYDADWIYTIEGNTNTSGSREGDGVYLKKRARRADYVQGYGYPKVAGGLKSADPTYKRPAAPSPTTTYVSDPGLKQIDSLLQAEIRDRTAGSVNRVQLEKALALVRDVRNPNN